MPPRPPPARAAVRGARTPRGRERSDACLQRRDARAQRRSLVSRGRGRGSGNNGGGLHDCMSRT